MYNILQEGVAEKKETKPPIREGNINYFRNFRTNELIFFTRVESKLTKPGEQKKWFNGLLLGICIFKGPDSNYEPFKWLNILTAPVGKQKS